MYLIGIIDQVLMTVEEEISDFLLEVGEVVGEVATGRIKNQMETGKVYTNTNRYTIQCNLCNLTHWGTRYKCRIKQIV